MRVKPGDRLRSVVDQTEIVVVRAPAVEVDLRCGGRPVVSLGAAVTPSSPTDPAHVSGTIVGKRYTDVPSGLEVLCTKPGAGSLSVGEVPLTLKDAKPLPSSD